MPAQSAITQQPGRSSADSEAGGSNRSVDTTITISGADMDRYCRNCKKYSTMCVCSAISFGIGYGAASIKSSAWSSKCPSFDNNNSSTPFPW